MGVKEILLERREKMGIEKGEAKKSHAVVENLILELGLQDDQVAKIAEVSVSFVKKVRKEIASGK